MYRKMTPIFILIILTLIFGFYFFNSHSINTNLLQSKDTEDVQNILATADVYLENGQYREALNAYNRAIQTGKNLGEAYARRGNYYANTRHYDQAVADYTMSLSYEKNSEVYASRCNSYRMLAKINEALSDCNKAIETDPNNVDAYIALAALNLQEQNLTQARDEVGKALKIDPTSAKAYYVLAQVEIADNHGDRAVEDLTKCIELDPTNPIYYWDRGYIYYSSGKIDEMKSDMQMILKVGNPNKDGELLLRAGNMLRAVGENP
jgi:tetratricopeptide (TPR) repeat protein